MNFQFVNSKGLFADYQAFGVISHHALGLLRQYHQDPNCLPEHKKTLDLAMPLFDALPDGKSHVSFKKNDLPNPTLSPSTVCAPYGYGYMGGKVILHVSNFVSKSNVYTHQSPMSDHPDRWGWAECVVLAKLAPKIQDIITSQKWEINFNGNALASGKKYLKKFQAGEFSVLIKDTALNLSEVNACGLYSPGSKGYLNEKGGYSPLGGARLFESAEAARRTKKSRSLNDAVVVHIRAQLTKVEPDQTITGSLGDLQDAIALVERKNIMQALESATAEQLQERLKLLEQKLAEKGEVVAPSAPVDKPRRM